MEAITESQQFKEIQNVTGRAWNEEFQRLLESRLSDPENELKRTTELRKLCEDFGAVAKKIGSVIIRELSLPIVQKTIPPATPNVGGIAGGEKYIYAPEGIFFKIAIDKQGLYGGDEFIMKAAGHELRGLMELMDCRVSGLYFPLMVVVDYRGYRLIAESILPLGPGTLIYGSSDGGRTIHADHPEMNARMETAANILNLKGHYVWNWSRTEKTLIFGPVDIEGHLGKDNRFYVIDTARVFPPETPVEGVKGCFLYRLLRPELVKNNRVPLSSDAFSRFPVEDGIAHNEEVCQASKYLEEVLARQVATFLGDHYSALFNGYEERARASLRLVGESGDTMAATTGANLDGSGIGLFSREEQREEFHRLVNHVHRQGVNMRWLGMIHSLVRPQHLVVGKFLLTEIVARTAKNILRGQMRRLRCPEDEPYVHLVVRYFNLLFSPSHRSHTYWNQHLAEGIHKRFAHAIDEYLVPLSLNAEDVPLSSAATNSVTVPRLLASSSSSSYSNNNTNNVNQNSSGTTPADIRQGVHMVALFYRLQDILGIKFSEGAVARFGIVHLLHQQETTSQTIDGSAQLVLLNSPFQAEDVLEIFPVVKYIHRISFEEGTALSLQAAKQGGEHSDTYFNIANEKYSAGLRIKPGDYRALHNWGLSLSLQAMTKKGKEADDLFELAAQKFQAALVINPNDDRALFLWGNMLSERSRMKRGKGTHALLVLACRKYQQAYEINPANFDLLYNWGNVLLYRAKMEEDNPLLLKQAAQKYCEARALKPSSYNALKNWGVALSKYARVKAPPKAWSLFTMAEQKFRECLQVKPQDHEVYFNWGNTLYRHARMQESRGDHSSGYSLLLSAGDKYLHAMDISPLHHDALYNWGKVLHCIATQPSVPSTSSFLERLVELYISLLTSYVLRVGSIVKLKPLIALARSGVQPVRVTAIEALLRFKNSGSVKIQQEAARVLRLLQDLAPSDSPPSAQFPATGSLTSSRLVELGHVHIDTDNHIPTIPPDGPTSTWDRNSGEDISQIASMVKSISRKLGKQTTTQEGGPSRGGTLTRGGRMATSTDSPRFSSEVDVRDFDVISLLGESSFQRELKVLYHRQQTVHLLRIVRKDLLQAHLKDNGGVYQGSSLPNLQHPFLLPLRWTIETMDNYFFVYDSIWEEAGILLSRFLHSTLSATGPNGDSLPPPPIIPLHHIRFIAAEVILALQHLHSLHFVYANLAPDTVMLDLEGHVRLTGFSFQRPYDSISSDVYNTAYISPEVIRGDGYGTCSDWWSLGNLIYELTTGWAPFHSQDINRHLQNVMHGQLLLGKLSGLSADLVSLLQSLLSKHPHERLGNSSADDIKRHPFFSEIDWDTLQNRQVDPPWKPTPVRSSKFPDLGEARDLSDFDESLYHFEALPTLVAHMKKGKFHGYTFVEPKRKETSTVPDPSQHNPSLSPSVPRLAAEPVGALTMNQPPYDSPAAAVQVVEDARTDDIKTGPTVLWDDPGRSMDAKHVSEKAAKDREKLREREREREREKNRDREREKVRDRDRERNRGRNKERDKDRDKERDRERSSSDREKIGGEREKEKGTDIRERSRERDRTRNKDRTKAPKEKDEEKTEKDRGKDKSRDRHKEKEKGRERGAQRNKDKSRDMNEGGRTIWKDVNDMNPSDSTSPSISQRAKDAPSSSGSLSSASSSSSSSMLDAKTLPGSPLSPSNSGAISSDATSSTGGNTTKQKNPAGSTSSSPKREKSNSATPISNRHRATSTETTPEGGSEEKKKEHRKRDPEGKGKEERRHKQEEKSGKNEKKQRQKEQPKEKKSIN